jgi:hypothetical protein
MAEIQDLSATDASNTGRWPENMPFSGVNDAGRADEGLLARWYKDTDSSITASGSSNAFAITSNRVIAALFNNLVMAYTANFSITGACTLNLNGLGAKSLKRFNGTDLVSGDIISGQPVVVIYKSSGDQWFVMSAGPQNASPISTLDFAEQGSITPPAADRARLFAIDDGSGNTFLGWIDNASNISYLKQATVVEMEAAGSTSAIVSPARQHRHPGHPKAWVNFVGTGTVTINADYGVSTITDNGTGDYSINFDTAFSSTAYAVTGSAAEVNTVGNATLELGSLLTTAAEVLTHYATSGGGRVDMTYNCVTMHGDQ